MREMKNLQMVCNSSEGKLMLEQKLGTTEDVEMFTEVLDNMIRDEEKGEDKNINIIFTILSSDSISDGNKTETDEEELTGVLMKLIDSLISDEEHLSREEFLTKKQRFLLQLILMMNPVTKEEFSDVIKTVQDNLETEAAVKMSLECHQDDDQDPELEMAIRMSLECHGDDDDVDVDMTQLNNRRRCFVLQKREFDRISDKKLETKKS